MNKRRKYPSRDNAILNTNITVTGSQSLCIISKVDFYQESKNIQMNLTAVRNKSRIRTGIPSICPCHNRVVGICWINSLSLTLIYCMTQALY